MDSNRIWEHYRSQFGDPSRTAEFRTSADEIEIGKWDVSDKTDGVNIYATVGAYRHAMLGTDPAHRIEFFVGLLPARDEVASPLAALGLYASQEGVAVGHGHTVPSDLPLWPGTPMHRLLVMRPVSAIVTPLDDQNAMHVEFLQAIPIFDSEFEYKRENGAEALIHRWEQAGVRFWDPDRVAG